MWLARLKTHPDTFVLTQISPATISGHFLSEVAMFRSLLIIGGAVFAAGPANAQGVLDRVRHEVRVDHPAPPRPPQPSSRRDPPSSRSPLDAKDPPNDDDDDYDSVFGSLLLDVVALPIYAGFAVLSEAQPEPMWFLSYPYEGRFLGFMSKGFGGSASYAETWSERIHLNQWFGRITLDEGYDFSNDVNRAGGSILLDSHSRFGVQSTWSVLSERIGDRFSSDTLTVGDTNLTFRYLETRRVIMRAGGGVRTMVDRCGTDWGWNAHLDADWFPKRPLVCSTVFDFGSLGNATVTHLRGTLGLTYHRWELYGGYDWLRIGTVDIQGPTIGLRCWF